MVEEKYIQDKQLKNLQEKYLETRSQTAWEELFSLAYQVCKNIVVSEYFKHKKFFTQEDVDDNALNACIYVLRRYKNIGYRKNSAPKNYMITDNYIVTLQYGVKHALYYRNTEQRNFENAVSYESISNKISDKRIIKNI